MSRTTEGPPGDIGVNRARSGPPAPRPRSEERFEQELELADLDLAIERVVGTVEDGDAQTSVVAVALEHGDDPGVLHLSLADADLELAGGLAGVAKVDVLHVGEERIEVRLRPRALEEVAGVERQAETGEGRE